MDFSFEDIQLAPTNDADLDYVLSLESHPENSRFVSPWRIEKHKQAQQNPDYFHGLIANQGERVGYLILAGLKNPNRSIEFMRIVVGNKNSGVGRKALRAVKAFCFEALKAHRLWLDVKTFNDRAKHLYVSEGFTEEGTLRDCIKTEEGYDSLTILSMLESEYFGAKA